MLYTRKVCRAHKYKISRIIYGDHLAILTPWVPSGMKYVIFMKDPHSTLVLSMVPPSGWLPLTIDIFPHVGHKGSFVLKCPSMQFLQKMWWHLSRLWGLVWGRRLQMLQVSLRSFFSWTFSAVSWDFASWNTQLGLFSSSVWRRFTLHWFHCTLLNKDNYCLHKSSRDVASILMWLRRIKIIWWDYLTQRILY